MAVHESFVPCYVVQVVELFGGLEGRHWEFLGLCRKVAESIIRMPDAGLVLRAFCLARVCLARSGCPAWPREQQEDRAQRDQRRTFHVNVGPALRACGDRQPKTLGRSNTVTNLCLCLPGTTDHSCEHKGRYRFVGLFVRAAKGLTRGYEMISEGL